MQSPKTSIISYANFFWVISYNTIINTITNSLIDMDDVSPAVRAWVSHKKIDIFACGVNRHCSDMPHEQFIETRRHTNAVEVTHHKTNSLGKRLSLLKAVKM